MTGPRKKYAFDIVVETSYIHQESNPDKRHYVFAYTITISNQGLVSAQLLRRHWWITNVEDKVQEVEGEGVVGEKPTIAPGDTYTYSSGAIIDTPVGTMKGEYEMLAEDGALMTVEVPMFTLAMPQALH